MEKKIIPLYEGNGEVTLTCWLNPVGGEFASIRRRPAILVIPGGGYRMCSDREADPVAFRYLSAGFQAFVLRYTVGPDVKWPQPLRDYETAMELIRSHAKEWAVYPDKVAVIGFSAGGHLAAAGATLSENKPDALLLGYPVTMGETAQECLADAPDTVRAVSYDTPPCFLFACRDDCIVPMKNLLRFANALDEKGVSFEMHIYDYGSHGFSTADDSLYQPEPISRRVSGWVDDSIAWLREYFGTFGLYEMTAPEFRHHVNEDAKGHLSADCTVGHILSTAHATEALHCIREKTGIDLASAAAEPIMRRCVLRGILLHEGAASEMIDEVDRALREMR